MVTSRKTGLSFLLLWQKHFQIYLSLLFSFFFLVYLLTLLGNLTVYKFQTLRKGSHDSECIMLRKKLGNPVNISLSCVFIT